MTTCDHDPLMIQALVDGELDAGHALATEARIATCPACAQTHERLVQLRATLAKSALAVPAPERLKRRLADSLAQARQAAEVEAQDRKPQPRAIPVARPQRRPWAWMGGGAGLAVAACAGLLIVGGVYRQDQALTRDLVASHVRSLQVAHLTDIQTSDHHLVKPWFDGKLDFSPPVIELKDQGFPLVGGRLDYVGGRPVAAIVYGRGRHVINLFVWPDSGSAGAGLNSSADGYGLRHWRAGGMTYWAVSDVNPADLTLFETDLKQRTAP